MIELFPARETQRPKRLGLVGVISGEGSYVRSSQDLRSSKPCPSHLFKSLVRVLRATDRRFGNERDS